MEIELKKIGKEPRNELVQEPSLPDEERMNEEEQTFAVEGSNTYGAYFRQVIKDWTNMWHFKCQICLRDFDSSESSFISNCKHNHFCHSCLVKYVKFKLVFFEEIRCPMEGCPAKMDVESHFFKTLPTTIQNRYKKISQSYQKLRDANFRICPSQKCQGNIVFRNDSFRCNQCTTLFCVNCLQRKHDGDCFQEEVAFFQNILHFRRCPNCKFIIEKGAGCNHMTCVCKYQFCYLCNDAYTPSHACQYDQNHNIIIKNPAAIKKPLLQEEKQSSQMDLGVNRPQPKKLEVFLYYLVLFVVLTPFYAIFVTGFTLWIAILTCMELIKVAFASVIIVFLGVGPFALEFALRSKVGRYFMLTIGLPLTMLIGIFRGFWELFGYITICLYRKYLKEVKKVWRNTFAEPLTT